ncbi:Sensor histidine kinase ResE [Austwickia sp. TVS 96-490-7B]|uniref:sensor histidine kinase n=1 Tax=Austwickia sp. TVS 96-490-7B TaxID=2830843 RepID=UPI001E09A0A8|nr:PAS domain-containing sensor histidine kinase [Austwickia sp. TVS 96-490-7B]MBW3084375.1 Sensor histidine kinase ResE [Austwickia sp. TVS 96-490-7B]
MTDRDDVPETTSGADGQAERRVDPAQILAVMPDGVLVVGADQRVVFLNPRAERLLGRLASDILCTPVRDALPLVEPGGMSWWDCFDPWGGISIRTGHRERMLHLPGRGHFLVTMSIVRHRRGGPVDQVVVILRDTEQRRRHEAGTAELISVVAHELRSPLTSIKAFSGTLLRRWERFSEPQRLLMMQTIEADAQRLSRLLSELLDVSRIDASRLRVTPRPVDLRQAVTAHIDRYVVSGHDRAKFSWKEAFSPRQEVWADADRLDQIIVNLVDNALKHGGGTVSIETASVPVPQGETPWVTLTVEDEGEGIDPENYPLIFEKFWHGSHRGSTGLGLYLVKGLVEAHGGRVSVGRAAGGGARFMVSLPAAESALVG